MRLLLKTTSCFIVDGYSKITSLLLTTQNLQHGLITVLNCQFKVHKGI